MKRNQGIYSILIKTYVLTISIFTVFRAILFLSEKYRIHDIKDKTGDIISAFVMGFRFDLSHASYVLILPALILSIQYIVSPKTKWVKKIIFWWVYILFFVSFLISAADIPYFHYFFTHFSIGAFTWAENPDIIASMILSETFFYIYFALALVAIFVFYRILSWIFAQADIPPPQNKGKKIGGALLAIILIFLGLRGSLGSRPLLVRDSYFCNDAFINQLGQNSPYFFIRSYLDRVGTDAKPIHFMDEQESISYVQKILNVDTTAHYKSPIARFITPDSLTKERPNIVIILMESMSAAKMGRYGNPNKLTPFLDSLSYKSYYFENLYSAGEHTFNGIFGTLFSFPAIYREHPMTNVKGYNGMPYVLHKLGYSTVFFTTHSAKFDNMDGFLINNNFEKIYSIKDYPKEEIKTSFGVPDDYLFRYSLPVMDDLHQKGVPFFVTMLTTSDHRPYYLPDYFTPTTDNVDGQMTQYADWSIRQFFKEAKQKPWFDNTIFVLLADHGAPLNVKYDIALNYHHIPMIIYAPKFIQSKQVTKIAGQIDCFPTIMELVHQPYINTTLGINQIKETRPYIFINGEDKLAVLDTQFLLIQKPDNSIGLYKYKNEDHTNYADQFPEKTQDMLKYMNANLQTYYYINQNANHLLME